ncbi:LCP family protein [Jeotgalicoccus huakuii]|nr:LCP family protein [Jeotgalicoccus huakuii]
MKKILWTLFIILGVVLLAAVIYILYLFNMFNSGVSDSYEEIDRDRSELRVDDVDASNDSFTVLILGIDADAERTQDGQINADNFRSDSMILATFDRENDDVKMVNVPRDTLSYISSVNYFDKINHAHAFAGPTGAMDSVESLLNVPVDYFVRVDMNAVVEIVDAIGGVDFNVPYDMNGLQAGEQHLDGEQALAVIRNRSVDSDLGRGVRQMELIEAVIKQAQSLSSLSQVDDLIQIFTSNTSHNFATSDIRSLASHYLFNDVAFESTQLQGTGFTSESNGIYYAWPDEEHLFALSNSIREMLALDPSEPNDLINIRLGEQIQPVTEVSTDLLENYELESTPPYAEEGAENQYGDGFGIE